VTREDELLRLTQLIRHELEAGGLKVGSASEQDGPVLVVGGLKVFPRRLLERQAASLRDSGSEGGVDLAGLAAAHRVYFRGLRRFHPSLVSRRKV